MPRKKFPELSNPQLTLNKFIWRKVVYMRISSQILHIQNTFYVKWRKYIQEATGENSNGT